MDRWLVRGSKGSHRLIARLPLCPAVSQPLFSLAAQVVGGRPSDLESSSMLTP